MLDAIGESGVHLFTAEVEIGFTRMAHWPAAYAIIEIQQAGLVGHLRAGLGGDQTARRGWRDRRLLITWPLPQKAAGTDRDNSWLRA